MIVYSNPRRTRLLLRIRRLLTVQARREKPNWPDEALSEMVTDRMGHLRVAPMRKIREAEAALNFTETVIQLKEKANAPVHS